MWQPVDCRLGRVSQNRKIAYRNYLTTNLESLGGDFASQSVMKPANRKIFDEEYRVVAVESQRLTIRGVRSGEVLTIINETPEVPLSAADYPLGKLITLSDPTNSPPN